MNYQEQINDLLASKQAVNNFLALQLMINVQKISFEEAFKKLLLRKGYNPIFSIEILNLKIVYTYVSVMIERYIIERKIYFEGQILEEKNSTVYDDWEPMYASEESMTALPELIEDRQKLAPFVEKYFKKWNRCLKK